MDASICVTCGTQYPPSKCEPDACPICVEERQYVGHDGQRWTTLERMRADGYENELREEEPGLHGVGTKPEFAIGQRALLVDGVLWDCISFLDDATERVVRERGGIETIAVSHPHFYSSMVEWAERFDARILLHEADRAWVMRPSERIELWSGDERRVSDELTLIRLGGHFAGSTVLHWSRGALLAGDTVQVVADRDWVSFMRSYPNLIPLPAREVARIRDALALYEFDRLYGGWWNRVVRAGAKEKVRRSAERYIRAIEG